MISWQYVERLHQVQQEEQLVAANKITSRHVSFAQKKMNTKLAAQVFSQSTADAIDFCRSIEKEGFEGSEATSEFFRINDRVFDLLNSKPYGRHTKAPLSMYNKMYWLPLVDSAIQYYKGLQILVNRKKG